MDKAKSGASLLFSHIADFLIRNRRITDCVDLIMPLADDDPLLLALVCDAFMAIERVKDTVLMLANKIKEYPFLVTLLLKQAQAFIKYEYFEYAMRLSRICVDLCPESFECWM